MATDLRNRQDVLRDAEYFANELMRRLERLQEIDYGSYRSQWQQASGLTKRIRGLLRVRIDKANTLERNRRNGSRVI